MIWFIEVLPGGRSAVVDSATRCADQAWKPIRETQDKCSPPFTRHTTSIRESLAASRSMQVLRQLSTPLLQTWENPNPPAAAGGAEGDRGGDRGLPESHQRRPRRPRPLPSPHPHPPRLADGASWVKHREIKSASARTEANYSRATRLSGDMSSFLEQRLTPSRHAMKSISKKHESIALRSQRRCDAYRRMRRTRGAAVGIGRLPISCITDSFSRGSIRDTFDPSTLL